MSKTRLTLGTRASALARWQTDYVTRLLRAADGAIDPQIRVFSTRGDEILDRPLPQIGGKGLFTAELEAALHCGEIDCAVHSLKDLPTDLPTGLTIGAIPPRAEPSDVLISKHGYTLDTLPPGASVATSSRRRASQLLARRGDLQITDLRGNLNTRISKALDQHSRYDAIMLAYAGVERLGYLSLVSQVLPTELMLPAPGQGALAVQCRDEAAMLALLAAINDPPTEIAVTAERAFLAGLGGGCAVPIAAYAVLAADELELRGRVVALDGTSWVDVESRTALVAGTDQRATACAAGQALARLALQRGAAAILEATVV